MSGLDDIDERLEADGEQSIICPVDRYPTSLRCQCGHGHGRHVGSSRVTCMSYTDQPDCSCDQYTPASPDVVAMWEDARAMLAVLQEIETRHVPCDCGVAGCEERCQVCGVIWPCPDRRSLEALDALGRDQVP